LVKYGYTYIYYTYLYLLITFWVWWSTAGCFKTNHNCWSPIKRYETIGLIPWVLWLRYDDQQRNNAWECRNERFVMDKYVRTVRIINSFSLGQFLLTVDYPIISDYPKLELFWSKYMKRFIEKKKSFNRFFFTKITLYWK
jgi:hypothetical protein